MLYLLYTSSRFVKTWPQRLRWVQRTVPTMLRALFPHLLLQRENVVLTATRLCHPPRLSNGRQSRTAGKVVDAGHRGFSFLCGSDVHRTGVSVFLQGQWPTEQQSVPAIEAQTATEMMGES